MESISMVFPLTEILTHIPMREQLPDHHRCVRGRMGYNVSALWQQVHWIRDSKWGGTWTVYLCVLHFRDSIHRSNFFILTDNTAVLIHFAPGDYLSIVSIGIQFLSQHNPGRLNIHADQLLQTATPSQTEWKVLPRVCQASLPHGGLPQWIFSPPSSINSFQFLCPHSGRIGVKRGLSGRTFLFIFFFPQFPLLWVLKKIKEEGRKLVLIDTGSSQTSCDWLATGRLWAAPYRMPRQVDTTLPLTYASDNWCSFALDWSVSMSLSRSHSGTRHWS